MKKVFLTSVLAFICGSKRMKIMILKYEKFIFKGIFYSSYKINSGLMLLIFKGIFYSSYKINSGLMLLIFKEVKEIGNYCVKSRC